MIELSRTKLKLLAEELDARPLAELEPNAHGQRRPDFHRVACSSGAYGINGLLVRCDGNFFYTAARDSSLFSFLI